VKTVKQFVGQGPIGSHGDEDVAFSQARMDLISGCWAEVSVTISICYVIIVFVMITVSNGNVAVAVDFVEASSYVVTVVMVVAIVAEDVRRSHVLGNQAQTGHVSMN